ncbi:hypothetical protein EX30DRAFT_325218 [Ascodesmis nigricans]|uniref:Mitochondrial genome maintenance protein Mgr2 n=1 Tax=Ascodesmis nigricans TaxID=341454 RepID=A0A4S2N5P9_9PEZI|nr:hypothetical protein EX30DRAFT_325218 [Ascodesmis nigricans]
MPPMPQSVGQHGPSTSQKLMMGAMMGGTVGLTIGFIFGTWSILKNGAGPNGITRTLGQYMGGSAATFGFFMSIGSVIRTEAPETSNIASEAWARSRGAPILMAYQAEKAKQRMATQ